MRKVNYHKNGKNLSHFLIKSKGKRNMVKNQDEYLKKSIEVIQEVIVKQDEPITFPEVTKEKIKELSDYSIQNHKDEINYSLFKKKDIKTTFIYMLDRIINAPTYIHRLYSCIYMMPIIYQKIIQTEQNIAVKQQ